MILKVESREAKYREMTSACAAVLDPGRTNSEANGRQAELAITRYTQNIGLFRVDQCKFGLCLQSVFLR
ncbi:hypothetical protein E2C01_074835 [Portunus trituberculatus]|uniref:Uncharacterized protein n=1 Tax=Portunus trituberculatus TaxID=210409 RepID=A0A5B7I4H7_PORTR|nr:hypothetical protein [Portunus trituberculatus]